MYRRAIRASAIVVSLMLLVLVGACAENGPFDGGEPSTPRWPSFLSPCSLSGISGTPHCGRVTVPEDRSVRGGRTIDINVVAIPAAREPRQPDPMYLFAGGPGQGSTILAQPWVQTQFPHRDVILFDQRGTGDSSPLRCDDSVGMYDIDFASVYETTLPTGFLADCKAILDGIADLRQYTTTAAVHDIEAVREAFGHEQVNLLGFSYGSRVAQAYMRRYAGRVRTAVLDGVAPVDMTVPTSVARWTDEVVDGFVTACSNDPGCDSLYPALRQELDSLVVRLEREPLVHDVTDPRDGTAVPVVFEKRSLGFVMRAWLVNEAARRQVPAMIWNAYRGDWDDLLHAYRRNLVVGGAWPVGMYLSVFCTEDVRWVNEAQARGESDGTLLGTATLDAFRSACALWPQGLMDGDFRELVTADVPTLLLSGELDPATPPELGQRVAAALPNARHVIAPFGGHVSGSVPATAACLDRMVSTFIATADLTSIDVSCLAEVVPIIVDAPPGGQ